MTRPCIGSSWEGAVHTPENNGGPVGGGRFWFCAEGTSGPVIIHRWMVPTEDGLPAVLRGLLPKEQIGLNYLKKQRALGLESEKLYFSHLQPV